MFVTVAKPLLKQSTTSVINNFQQLFQKEKLNSSKSDDIAEFGVYFNNSAIKSVADSAIETEGEVEVSQLSDPNIIVRYNRCYCMVLMKELRGIVKRNVFRGVHLHELNEQEQKEIITGRMNLIQKQIFHNNVQQPETIIKSRYVGHEFKQDGDKYNHNLDIYAPTAALSSAYIFFTLAAVKHSLEPRQRRLLIFLLILLSVLFYVISIQSLRNSYLAMENY